MQVDVDVKCMQTNFCGRDLSGFGDFVLFVCLQKQPNFTFRQWTIYSPWGSKNRISSKIHASRGCLKAAARELKHFLKSV